MTKKNRSIEYKGDKYKYSGNGCKATGADAGWRMSSDLYFRCIDCGDLMNGGIQSDYRCLCGKLSLDSEWGRFGSRLGDDAIEVYKKEKSFYDLIIDVFYFKSILPSYTLMLSCLAPLYLLYFTCFIKKYLKLQQIKNQIYFSIFARIPSRRHAMPQ